MRIQTIPGRTKGLIVIALLTIIFALPVLSSAEVITLTLTDQNPAGSWGSVHALQPWAKKVEEVTKGKVKIEIYPGQTLTKGKESWDAVRYGVADMGWCFHGFWPDMTPLANVVSLPALPIATAEKGSEALWKLYKNHPNIQREFKDNHILLLFTSNPYILITTKKQVKTLEDLRGLKIRATPGPPTAQMKALGGVPIYIPMPENYMSLQKGVIDGMGAPWDAIFGFKLYEVVRYFTEVPFPVSYFSIAMNKNKWNSLSKDIQDAITGVSGLEGSRFWGRNYFDTAKNGVLKKAWPNINVYSLSADERARWLEVGGKPMWEEWTKKMESKGHPEAKEILKAMIEMLK